MKTKLERIKNDIETLAQFNSTPGKGLTRFTFTNEDRETREYIKSEMRQAGLKVYEDVVGNVIGRLEGDVKGPVVMLGSHFDSVRNGGNFDGQAGVVMAMEIARVMTENKMQPKLPVEFIALVEEEGGRFGSGLFASRALVGRVTREQLDVFKDQDGVSIAEAMKSFGLDPDKIEEAKLDPKDIKAFLELHIEQGPALETGRKDIGIVEHIVGIRQFEVLVKGRPDHAGTTPMNMRVDALDAASYVISRISTFAKEAGDGTVATVGVIKALPGASNIVPGEVSFVVDIRSKNARCIDNVTEKIKDSLKLAKEIKGIEYIINEKLNVAPTELSKEIIDIFTEKGKALNFSMEMMISGAGHDAMVMAGITDVGLVFVPSKNGRSHCPEEWTDYADLQKGIELVLDTIMTLSEVKQ